MTLVFGGLLTYLQAVAKIETEVTSALAIAEKTVRKSLPDIQRDDDPHQELVRLVRVFDGNRHVRAALIEPSRTGEPVASVPALAGDLPEWFSALFARPPRVISVELPENLSSFGTIELATESSAEIGEVWNEVLLKLAILMLFCAALGMLVYVTLGRALEPLASLSAAFERLGSADYGARVAERGPAELVKLCAGFNLMAKRLGDLEDKNQQLNDQLATVQEEERADLARDLHDEVSPFLFSVEVDAATVRNLADASSEPLISQRADAIRDAVAHMKKHVRSILGRLRPAVHLELGIEDAIEALVSSWRVRNPAVVFKVTVPETGFGQKLDTVIYGLVREAISNAMKHGKAREIEISVTPAATGSVLVEVRDDGIGIDPNYPNGGFGLIAMRERVAALGGTLSVQNRPDRQGVEVAARIPAPMHNAAKGQVLPQEMSS